MKTERELGMNKRGLGDKGLVAFALRLALLLPFLSLFLPLSPALADVKIDITRGVVEPIPIAIPG